MKIAGKKQKLVESIKQNLGNSNSSDRKNVKNMESYGSHLNTAIDYAKNHYINYEQ